MGDCDHACFDDGKGNALGYGGESGTVGFSVIRRVRKGGRHVARTCLVPDWEVDELDFGHRSAVGGIGRRCIRVGEYNQFSDGGESGTVGFSVDWRVVRGSRHVGLRLFGC